MTASIIGIVTMTVVCMTAAVSAQMQVSATTPARLAKVEPTTVVAITFDRAVATGSINATTFRVFGKISGTHTGAFSFSNGDQTVTLTPSQPFATGELVLVNLSHDITGADTTPLRSAGYAYAFYIRTLPSELFFQPLTTLAATTFPGEPVAVYGAIAADLDHDGYADLTTVDEASTDLRVFLNSADGSGLFQPFLTPPVAISDVASPNDQADFDNDGHTDFCLSGDTLLLVLGNGDGTFAPVQSFPVGADPRGVAVLDVDGDADSDVVVANQTSNNLSLLVNDGTGNFAPATFFDGGVGFEFQLSAADMNNDGITDVVVASFGTESITVALGNGNGTFTVLPARHAWPMWNLTTGDVNGDGKLDVATANGNDTGGILLGNGDGTFGADSTVGIVNFAAATDLGDLDGDGDLDWVLTSGFSGGAWQVFTNDGLGRFALERQFPVLPGGGPACSTLLDIDNDADLDLALSDELLNTVAVIKQGVDSPLPCPPAPGSCREPMIGGKTSLTIKNFGVDKRDQILWKWLRGAATTKAEFGDPLATDHYTLCIYENGTLVSSASAEAGGTCNGVPCWTDQPRGYQFKDPALDPFGVQRLQLKEGDDGRAKILFRGKRVYLQTPDLSAASGPIEVQLISSASATCWGATFSAPFDRNDGQIFKDKSD